jgi:hypothetical protein
MMSISSGKVGAAAEIRAVRPDHEHLDVVVDAGVTDEVSVPVLRHRSSWR